MNTNTYKKILEKFFRSEVLNDYTLEKIHRACEYFGHPEKSFRSIHIAGTNGKGSVSKMIFQILKESGKRVGVYTSPHNIDIRERFEVANCNVGEQDFSLRSKGQESWKGQESGSGLIPEDDFARLATRVIETGLELSYYEKCVILAFLYFREQGCEYAVIEVGMGGRLDATNVIVPILSIITSISYDHMEHLGYTLEAIATEKGGIIKPGVPVILYGENPTLGSIAEERDSRVIFPLPRDVTTNLLGEHQTGNAQIAYEVGIFLEIEKETIESALLHVDHHGRLEYLRSNLLIDGAHNEDGLKKLKYYLESLDLGDREVVLCFNLKKGKSSNLVLDAFPLLKKWIIVDSSHQMVESATLIVESLLSRGYDTKMYTPSEIFVSAEKSPEKFFVIFGSLYMMGEFLGI